MDGDSAVPLDGLRVQGVRAAAHHARTPLSIVTGALHAAAHDAGLSDPTRRELADAAEHAAQLATWIDQLSDVGTWPHEPDPQRVRFGALLEDLGRNLLAAASWRGVTYEIEVGEVRAARADPRLASWVVRTLVRNAIELAGPRGRITLRTRDDAEHGVVEGSVEIAPDGSVDAQSVAADGEMRIVAGVMALHAGTFSRQADGRNVTITVRLPAADGTSAEHGEIRVEAAPDHGEAIRTELQVDAGLATDHDAVRRADDADAIAGPVGAPLVLLVEDDDSLRSYVLRTLCIDYRVVAVATAEAADGAIEQLRPDVIVCDLFLPGRSGEQMVHDLHADHHLDEIPVIVLTGDHDEERRIRLLHDGADDYIVKPFTVDELRARIANLVQTRLDVDELRDRAARTQQLAAQLQAALDSRVVIEQAKAFIAADRCISVDEAFEVMRRHARGHNMKLRELAARIVAGFRP